MAVHAGNNANPVSCLADGSYRAQAVLALLLEAAEDASVTIPFERRSGICGQCKTHLISGTVTMEVRMRSRLPTGRSGGSSRARRARRDVSVDA
jgi:RNase P subunit RPR2